MSKSSQSLFVLVKNLSKKEKRLVNKFIKLLHPNISNELIILLEIISRQKEFDEERVKKLFVKKTNSKYYYKIKHLLYRTILKALNFYEDKKYDFQAKLKEIETLLNKGLVEEGFSEIQKQKETLKKQEEFEKLLMLLRLEHLYYPLLNFYIPHKHTMFDEAQEYLKALQLKWKYKEYYNKIYEAYKSNNIQNAEELYNDFRKEFKTEPEYVTLKSQHYVFLEMYYGIVGVPLSYRIAVLEKMVTLFTSNIWLIEKKPIVFFVILNNLIFQLIAQKDWKKAINYIKLHEDYCNKFPENREAQHILLILAKLHIKHYSGVVDNTDKLLEEAVKYYNCTNVSWKHLLSFHIALLYFARKYYAKSLEWLNLNIYNSDSPKFVPTLARLLPIKLIIIYEAGFVDLLPYTLRSAYRTLKAKGHLLESEKLTIELVKNILKNSKDTKRLFIDFYQKITNNESVRQTYRGLFDIELWLKSKIEGNDFDKVRLRDVDEDVYREILEL